MAADPVPAGPEQARVDEAAAVEALRRADPVLRQLIDEVGPLDDFCAGRPTDHYAVARALDRRPAALDPTAAAIYGRLLERFGGRPPTPERGARR